MARDSHVPCVKGKRAGYYHFLRRPDPAAQDRQLLEEIYQCLREEPENANYEVRRIIWWLRLHRGYTSGDRRIYRICRENNLMILPKLSVAAHLACAL